LRFKKNVPFPVSMDSDNSWLPLGFLFPTREHHVLFYVYAAKPIEL